uniref:putative pentatricopeptide repeat-containing protein At3g25970 n=1 Tax=Erigeron canadensis TaxID=72917 RepID=UPI001CB9BBD8|nr:putative pentatricopeptide repeat-containing protein At3g25970 [Erigeron canadensis]
MQSLKSLIYKKLYGQALKITTTFPPNTTLTNKILTQIIKSNTHLNPFQSATLIANFTRAGHLSRATYLLRHTQNPDIVVFNSLISSHARLNQPDPAFKIVNLARHLGLSPDEVTFSNLIKCCDDLDQIKVVHLAFSKLGFAQNVFLISGLIEKYVKFGCLDSAEKCFDECVCFDGVIWSVMINGYVKNGEFDKGRECFMKMSTLGFELNEFSLSSVLGGVFDVHEGEQIHGWCMKRGYLSGCSLYLNNAIMVMYGRCGFKSGAVKVFDEMPDRDVVSWTGRISVAFDCMEAFEMFRNFILRGFCEVNEYTLINVLSFVEGVEMLEMGKQIQTIVWKAGYLVDTSVCNALISMYSKTGQIQDARQVFDDMVCRDSVSWNSMVSSYSQHHHSKEAIELFSRMRNSLLQPSDYTVASMLEVSSNLKWVMQMHSLILKLGFMFTNSIICHLITLYGKCHGIDNSESVFNEIEGADVVHVNAMAGAYDRCGCYSDIQSLFHSRWNSGLDIDVITFSIALKSCGALSDLHQGRSLHSLAIKNAINVDKFVESAIIDVYSKCGSIEDAEEAFWNATNNNVVAWNAMIMGYAQFGSYSKAYDLLVKMSEFGMKPDEITYLGVLSSCSHAGMVSAAKSHLNSMYDLHGVIPCLEHYACVVDVLGKVGKLDDAKKIIDHMPMIPDARIWQILLSACNIYGMWNDMRQLRREMKNKVVCKEAGCSWIQLKGSTHYFLADDTLHPQNVEIYIKLHVLMNQMLQLPKEQHANSFGTIL